MPFYNINGTTVHMRGTKLPPPCAVLKRGLHAAFTCTWCRVPSAYLCDWPTATGKDCDTPLCEAHAGHVGPNRNYCPEHLLMHQNPAPKGLFTSLVQP